MKNYIGISILVLVNFNLQAQSDQSGFPFTIPNSGLIESSSTNVVDFTGDGKKEIIVGDSKGTLYVIKSDGSLLWQKNTGSIGINSKPAVADLNNDGKMEIVTTSAKAGSGNSGKGLLTVLSHSGEITCTHTPRKFAPDEGIYSSPAVANLDKSDPELEIAFGDWGAEVAVLNHDCSVLWKSQSPPALLSPPGPLPTGYDETKEGFTVYVNDTVWASPAIADINKDGQLDVIMGIDNHVDMSHSNIGNPNDPTIDGGRIIAINGHNGSVIFSYKTEEVIYSAMAVADINNDNKLDVIASTGYCWQNAACAPNGKIVNAANQVFVVDANGQNVPGWPYTLESGYVVRNSSPAVADIDGDGKLEVIINASLLGSGPPENGKLFVINSDGSLKWDAVPKHNSGGQIVETSASASSAIVADINNDGELNVVLPSNFELIVWNNKGEQIMPVEGQASPFPAKWSVGSTPSINDLDNDGDLELIIGTSDIEIFINSGTLPAVIHAWDLATPSSSNVPWGTFRKTADNHGAVLINLPDPVFKNSFE